MSADSPQEYRGNGAHAWEAVVREAGYLVARLRVPGGWLYRDQFTQTMVYVPMPDVVKHKV